jgi:hypothetical protein
MPWRCFGFIHLDTVAEASGTSTGSMVLQPEVIVNLNLGSLPLFVNPINA